MAVTDLGRVCPVPKGVYDADTEYDKLDIVTYVGSGYMCKATSTGNLPTDTDYWILLSAGSAAGLLEVVYPVGVIIELAVATNPATLFGFGTWVAHGTGRVTIAIDSGDTDFDTVGETGGAKTGTHTLSSAGFAKVGFSSTTAIKMAESAHNFTPTKSASLANGNNTAAMTTAADLGGSTDAGSIVQSYIVVYRWRRTA